MSSKAMIEGDEYCFDGNMFSLFGYQAVIPKRGASHFALNTAEGIYMEVEMPEPVLPEIMKVLEADASAGKIEDAAYVLADSRRAAFLLLEHALSPDQFASAREENLFDGKYGPCILLEPVRLGEWTLPMVIVAEDKGRIPALATLDKDGNIL